MTLKDLFKKYNHAVVFLYAFIYMPWFLYLEKTVTTDYHIISFPLDKYIPFVEYFIIPYLLWFAMIAFSGLYLFFKDKEEFLKMAALLIAGMTIFLIICTVYPNGLDLRPTTFERDNIFVDLVHIVYQRDTPTNVLPSMHVFESIGLCIGLMRTKTLKNRPVHRVMIVILTVLIVLSTMFLKQHSVVDVIVGCLLVVILYFPIYNHKKNRG